MFEVNFQGLIAELLNSEQPNVDFFSIYTESAYSPETVFDPFDPALGIRGESYLKFLEDTSVLIKPSSLEFGKYILPVELSGFQPFNFSNIEFTPLESLALIDTDLLPDPDFAFEPLPALVDTTPPLAPILQSISDDTGVTGDQITSDNTLFFNGTAEAGASVEVFVDGVSVGTVTADGAGDWSFDYTGTTLADGSYNITAQATDTAGNTGPISSALPITIDTSGPAAPIVDSISDDTGVSGTDEITNDNALIFTGTAEAGASVQVFVDGISVGTTTADGSGNWSFDHSGVTLADGDYDITAQATDTAGNTGPLSSALPITVDTGAPSVVVSLDDTALNSGDTATVTFTFSEAVDGFDLSDVSAGSGTLSGLTQVNATTYTATLTPDASTEDATNVVSVANGSYTDIAGNAGTGADSPNYTVDTTPPDSTPVIDETVIALTAPDHTFETSASEDYMTTSSATFVQTTTAMSFNNGQSVQFGTSGANDTFANEGTQMLGMVAGIPSGTAPGTLQAQVETDLGLAAGTFDTVSGLDTTDGSYAQTSFYVQEGSVISFDWNFISPETAAFISQGFNDVAFVIVNGVVTELHRASDIGAPGTSGWQTYSFTATQEGIIDLAVAVFNVEDFQLDAGLVVDNFQIDGVTVEKQPVELNINLNVTDSSIDTNDVVITISGVDATSTLSAGTDMGGGVWELAIGDLEGLTITPPDAAGAGYTGTESLTITIVSTDNAGNVTTDVLTQDVVFGVQDNTEFGTSAADTIAGTTDDDTILGRAGGDTITGDAGDDLIDGGTGGDIISGDAGEDIILGGEGADTLTGGADDDVFKWVDGDEGLSLTNDIITDFENSYFSGTQQDEIDLSDLLTGESHDTLADYIFVSYDGGTGDSTLHINVDGLPAGDPVANADQTITVEDVDLTGGSGDQATILTNLVQNGVIITDNTDTVV